MNDYLDFLVQNIHALSESITKQEFLLKKEIKNIKSIKDRILTLKLDRANYWSEVKEGYIDPENAGEGV